MHERDLDARVRLLQERRLADAQRKRRAQGTPTDYPPSRWRHVPLADLFKEAGNTVQQRGANNSVCGHQPFHKSSSGTCVRLWPDEGKWRCFSPGCEQGGDAATLVRALQDCTYAEAAAWLTARYGPPKDDHPRRPRGLWRS